MFKDLESKLLIENNYKHKFLALYNAERKLNTGGNKQLSNQ